MIKKSFGQGFLLNKLTQDYENDALNNLKKILINKWDFVTMQAEEQVQKLSSKGPFTYYVSRRRGEGG